MSYDHEFADIMNFGLSYSKGIMGVKDRRFKFSKWRNWGRKRGCLIELKKN